MGETRIIIQPEARNKERKEKGVLALWWLLSKSTNPIIGFSGGSEGKESSWKAGGPSSIPKWGRSPGEANGNPLQYSCLENPMDRGAWRATVHGVTKSQTRQSD